MKIPGPDHPITVQAHNGRVIVRFGGTVIADSTRALELKESSYKPVFYLPRGDAALTHFERSDLLTHCPYKGDATYFHLNSAGVRAENAVWSYEKPFSAMQMIAGHLAFYPDKVTIEAA